MFWEAQDWHTSTIPDALLEAARPLVKVTSKFEPARGLRRAQYERRLRLFGCACARTVWELLPTDARSAVAVSERFAEGRATRADVDAAAVRVSVAPATAPQYALCAAGWAAAAVLGPATGPARDDFGWNVFDAARCAAKAHAARAAGPAPPGAPTTRAWEATWNAAFAAARAHQAEFVRDIFPPLDNVVRALWLEPEWRTDTVVALARQMDETGDFSAVPILADALQDAGCENELLLARCRAPSGAHCRGNWAVDLVLGRE